MRSIWLSVTRLLIGEAFLSICTKLRVDNEKFANWIENRIRILYHFTAPIKNGKIKNENITFNEQQTFSSFVQLNGLYILQRKFTKMGFCYETRGSSTRWVL
uniref:AlNc14C71G4884 protein n=1 Tax=Albugo laibachii Nc14 TaxID=890382 RepID=F0WE22_9STRA|nr:AlNc14C71G4884 [Albugo laibachii Nc14]|eukprot:CCA19451.1 AlNc14C71G4884 [Albugo laibachii Nc14]